MHLRHDPDAAVVMTEALQPYVSVRGAVDTAVVAIRQPLQQWTQPFGAWHGGQSCRAWHGGQSFGAWPAAPALSPIFKGSLNLGRMGICGEYVTCGPCVELSTACPMQQCMGSVVGKDCIPKHTCRCGSRIPALDLHSLLALVRCIRFHSLQHCIKSLLQTKTGTNFSVLCCRCSICCCCLCTPVFGMLHGHTSSSCILSTLVILCSLLPGLQAAEMAMVLFQHHYGVISTPLWCYFDTTMVLFRHQHVRATNLIAIAVGDNNTT